MSKNVDEKDKTGEKMQYNRKRVKFVGHLDDYKYYDMDQVTAAALEKCEEENGNVGNCD